MPEESPTIARVVVNLTLDREFDYRIPARLLGRVQPGSRVLVPFGHGERVGYVVGLAAESTVPAAALKEIRGLENEQERIPENLIRLARWIADYYCCAREAAVRALIPAVVRKGTLKRQLRRFVSIAPGVDLAAVLPALEAKKGTQKRAAVLRALVAHTTDCELRKLTAAAGVTPAVVEGLAAKGLVAIEERSVDRDPFAQDVTLPSAPLPLTPDQRQALDQVLASMAAPQAGVILLHGVTGSGKTEVYLQAMATCLDSGREAILLVPEIALTPQTVDRFRGRFGDTVSVLHSGLNDGERYDEWRRIREGRARIVVGARSALFAPVTSLGLVVVDEEHETTYKQEESPRYNARDVAVVRGRLENATVLLGSATPALESFHNARTGKYRLASLPSRIDGQLMPVMEVVDMRDEAMQRGRPQIISHRLETEVRERLARGEQTILFLNRRGYATQMLCPKCGYVAECPHCNTSFTYHKQAGRLTCHLCGEVTAAPATCPACGDKEIRYTGHGTERIESVCQKIFPGATVARMDSDTMTTRDAYRKTLNAFKAHKIDILIGTQMIAKGLHFPNVTLVGVLAADMGLHMPDFRAGERTFQLLVQVAGRAGRGDIPGRVLVQTYTPGHPVLLHALRHDYLAFAEEELATREALQFPPATHLVRIRFQGPDEAKLGEQALAFAEALQPRLPADTLAAGPMPCKITRLRDLWRYQLLLRTGRILELSRLLKPFAAHHRREGFDVAVDIDPYSLL
ncbi:MAG: primosomal protein N' [Lentisphaeria bacterium]|jgi:primosomal protein N' (replication factor Y)